MHPLAHRALDQLLVRAERKNGKGLAPGEAIYPFTDGQFPEYTLVTAADLEIIHSDLLAAQRNGGIRIDWEQGAGVHKRVLRIRVADVAQLVRQVGRVPMWDLVSVAEQELKPWAGRPRVSALLESWAGGKSARGKGPASVQDWKDALRVIDHLASSSAADIPVRRLSAELFQDSKRIEAIALCLDFLTAAADQPARETADLLSELGLLRFPQPVYIATSGCQVELAAGGVLPSIRPYCALPPEAISGIDRPLRYLVTIENLTTFHETVRIDHPGATAVLYTGGMPSPSFLQTYGRLAATAGKAAELYHWGDPDLGGLRIAAKLFDVAARNGLDLRLWGMHGLSSSLGGRKALQRPEIDAIRGICEARGWGEVSADIERRGVASEQEQLPIQLPWSHQQ